jgi:hypothetical protein
MSAAFGAGASVAASRLDSPKGRSWGTGIREMPRSDSQFVPRASNKAIAVGCVVHTVLPESSFALFLGPRPQTPGI